MASGSCALERMIETIWPLHPAGRFGGEARIGQRPAQERDRGIAVLGQHPGRYGRGIVIGVESEIGRQGVARLGEALRVKIAAALFQKRHHQQRGAAPVSRRIEAGAAFEAQFQRGEGDRMFLDQPGMDAAGRGHLADLDGGDGRTRPGSETPAPRKRCASLHNLQRRPGRGGLSGAARCLTRVGRNAPAGHRAATVEKLRGGGHHIGRGDRVKRVGPGLHIGDGQPRWSAPAP